MSFLRGLKKGMHLFGETIAAIINSFLLAIVYILGVGGTSIIAKITSKSFLDLKIDKEKKTYWNDLRLKKESKEKYYRQF